MCFTAAVSSCPPSWMRHAQSGAAHNRPVLTIGPWRYQTHPPAAGKAPPITVHKIATPRLVLQIASNSYASCVPAGSSFAQAVLLSPGVRLSEATGRIWMRVLFSPAVIQLRIFMAGHGKFVSLQG